jgi:hypothetical protein
MSFKSRDLMVKLSGSGQEGCDEQTKPPQGCGDCTHHTQGCGDCSHVTDKDCTPTVPTPTGDDQTGNYPGGEEQGHGKREASGAPLALLRRQLQETLARPQV